MLQAILNRLEGSSDYDVGELQAEIRAIQLELQPRSPIIRTAKESNAAYKTDMKFLKESAVAYRAKLKLAAKSQPTRNFDFPNEEIEEGEGRTLDMEL